MTLLWKPLLASSLPIDTATNEFNWSLVQFPVYASPKLDGYRAMVQRGKLVSRAGLLVLNKQLQARYGRKVFDGLDAELCTGLPTAQGVFNATSRVVRKAEAEASTTKLYVIDRCGGGVPLSFRERHLSLLHDEGRDRARWGVDVIVIKQTLIRNLEALQKYERAKLAEGYEGVMLRRADQGEYPQKPGKENRSTLTEFNLVRMKRFEHAMATIMRVHPLRHNDNEERTATGKRSTKKAGIRVDPKLIGSATLLDDVTGVEFETTIGSAALRAWPGWKDFNSWRGRRVRYKYQVCGTKDKPRINTCAFEELL